MVDFYEIIFVFIVSSIITFGIWRDINYFRLRKRVKRLEEKWKNS